MSLNVNNWTNAGMISAGGTVSGIAGNEPVWLATEAGIYQRDKEGHWCALAQGQPLPQISALAAAADTIVVGSGLGDIVFSRDGGGKWFRSKINQTPATITWLLLAPDFEANGVALAGTAGDGILRTTNGCKHWQPANFGLQDFTVLVMAAPPVWGRRETVFVATANGLYRSSNGGRAWKRSDTGLEGMVVQALVVSPAYENDRTLLAGTETHGIYRSNNGGKTWKPSNDGLPTADETTYPPINALWFNPVFDQKPECVAACGDGQLFYGAEAGQMWTLAHQTDTAILSLSGGSDYLYAGLYKNGMLVSEDGGQSWQPVTGLAARLVTRLHQHSDTLVAFGPSGQIWQAGSDSNNWQGISFPDDTTLLTLIGVPSTNSNPLLAATPDGLLHSVDGQRDWQSVLAINTPLVIHTPRGSTDDQRIWVGTDSGDIFVTANGGQSWTKIMAPQSGQPVVAITGGGDMPLVSATYAAQSQQLTLWLSQDDGKTWQQWQHANTPWPSVQVAWHENRAVVCIGRRCWIRGGTGWEKVLETNHSIIRLETVPDTKTFILMTTRQVLSSTDGRRWQAWDEGLPAQQFLDLVVRTDKEQGQSTATLMTTGGVLWQRIVPA
jgi:photosystem II stability/assembly factor-like uncharacterized protein